MGGIAHCSLENAICDHGLNWICDTYLWPIFFHFGRRKATFVFAMFLVISAISSLHEVPRVIALTRVSQQPVELAYDDGDAEAGWFKYAVGLGGYDAVRFTQPYESSQILTVKYYIYSSPASFNVLILDANRRSIYDKPATSTTEGWFEVDLSKKNIVLDGDFYAAMKWTVPKRPVLGADETNPHGRSFIVGVDGTWETYAVVNKANTNSNKDGDFMIRVTVAPRSVRIALQTEPNVAGITIDGVSYSASRLPVAFTWEIGSVHTLLVDPMINGTAGVRYIFVEWSDGYGAALYSIEVKEQAIYTARFKTQYPLTVASPMGDPHGSGWYDAGSSASFSVTSSLTVEGFLGALGGKYVFDHWSGDSSATTPTASVAMDGPKTVTAMWRSDNTMPYAIIGVVVGAIVIVVALGLLARRRRGPSPTQTYKPPAAPLGPPSKPQQSAPANVPALQTQAQDTRYVEYLAKLEELKTRGEISGETYQRLKDDYWEKLEGVAPSPLAPSGVEPTAGKFCMNCGASLPTHATFCNKCGSKQ